MESLTALVTLSPKGLHPALCCIEYAITALERRYAEWDSDPGTRAELNSIQKTILALERHMKEKLGAVPAQESSGTTHQSAGRTLEHISRSFFLLGPD